MRTVFGLASLSVVTGFCFVQACGGEDAATPSAEEDAGGSSTSSSGTTSSSGATSSSGGSSSGNTSSSGGTNDGGNDAGNDAGAKSKMTFFASSAGVAGKDGNLGGIKGADDLCKSLATKVGGGDHTWAAYLSTTNEDAKDRIGPGPWVNQKGVEIAKTSAALHTKGFNIKGVDNLDENGAVVPTKQHDILTGTNPDGTKNANRCKDWTSNSQNDDANVGHADSDTTTGSAVANNDSWNNAHTTQCNAGDIANKGGAGRIYCFAKD